jgi:hypothetical protein
MNLVNYDAIDAAELTRDPFDFLVVPGFIGAESLRRINADYPAIETAANHALDRLSYGPAFGELIAALQGETFRAHLGARFDLDLSRCPTTVTVRKYCERTDGNIHTDHKSKVITVLVYFNEQWTHESGKLRMLRSDTDIEDYAAEVEPLGGTLLAFRRTDHSWHGHKQFVGERRMLQLNFLSDGLISVLNQRLARFGTHFQKRVLGIR